MFRSLTRFALLTLLAAFVPLALDAVPVSAESARRAAGNWAARGRTMGARLGRTVDAVATHLTTNGTSFYAVRLHDGGSVFLSSDTEMPPVIGFTAEEVDEEALDSAGPLWVLLNRDLSVRGELLRRSAARLATSSVAAEPTASEREWAELLADTPALTTSSAAIETEAGISDVRVAPLVKSKWGQSTARGGACWNYYTPNGSDPAGFVAGAYGNVVCGCVATSMSQVMRYHRYPSGSVARVTNSCTWNNTSVLSLTTQGGKYDWDAMTLDPVNDKSLSEANRQAIGKLTSDAGISVYMNYHTGGANSSGAYSFDITYALLNVWGYQSAVHFSTQNIDQTAGSDDRSQAFSGALFANFDAGYPVCMGIPGHSIIADGYGFDANANDYVHLNMGWSGSKDFWYNLPDVTKANSAFTSVDEITYNIFPDKSSNSAIISGRLTDKSGNPVSGARVTVWNGSVNAGETTSSSSGVWGLVVSAGTYTVVATSADGALHGSLYSVKVSSPSTTRTNWNRTGRYVPTVSQPDNVGNSWGNDIVMGDDPAPIALKVIGPSKVPRKESVQYTAQVVYPDGSQRTVSAVWSISGNTDEFYGYVWRTYATLSEQGLLTAGSYARSGITITATYGESGVTVSGNLSVEIVESVSFKNVVVPTAVSYPYKGVEQVVPTSSGYTLSGEYHAKDVGVYRATLTLNDGYRWSDGTFEPKTVNWSIVPVPLIVVADDLTVVAGEDCPVFTASYYGFVGDDGPADLGGFLEFSCAYEPSYGVAGDVYPIMPVGLESNNYDIDYRYGALTVLPPPAAGVFYLARRTLR